MKTKQQEYTDLEVEAKEPEYRTPEIEAKIKKYGRMKKMSTGFILGGFALAITSSLEPNFILNHNKPEIAQDYRNSQTNLQTLQDIKKDLGYVVLGLPNQTTDIKELGKYFNKNRAEKISKLNKAIESTETNILKIEINQEFRQYTKNKNTRQRMFDIFYVGAILTMLSGMAGWLRLDSKKRRLELKYKKLK